MRGFAIDLNGVGGGKVLDDQIGCCENRPAGGGGGSDVRANATRYALRKLRRAIVAMPIALLLHYFGDEPILNEPDTGIK